MRTIAQRLMCKHTVEELKKAIHCTQSPYMYYLGHQLDDIKLSNARQSLELKFTDGSVLELKRERLF